jgi:hypothetical protein
MLILNIVLEKFEERKTYHVKRELNIFQQPPTRSKVYSNNNHVKLNQQNNKSKLISGSARSGIQKRVNPPVFNDTNSYREQNCYSKQGKFVKSYK